MMLEDYELYQELGGGPLTQIFEARHRSGEFHCAVKLLRDEWNDDSRARQLLRGEARAGLAIRHRHLVKLLDAHVAVAPYYVVMELLAGESMRSRLCRESSLSARMGIWIARQIAEAIAAIHKAGFVHADIKPDNIRILDDGTAVLVDLGFAHRPGEHAALIRDGCLVGTPEYLAPELFNSERDHAFPSDWFSFGLTLLAMLAGERQQSRDQVRAVLRSRSGIDARQWMPAIARGWPPRLFALVESLLHPQPARRPIGPAVVSELIALEIGTLSHRRAA